MSPAWFGHDLGLDGFPRVSGDEPVVSWVSTWMIWFSPRERG